MHKRGLCRHAMSVRLSVRLSVTFVDHVKTNKHIFEFFSPSGSILVLPYQTGWRYSDGNPPLTGASNAGGVGKKRDSGRISGFAAYRSIVFSTLRTESRSVKNKAATKFGRTAASVEPSTHCDVRRPLFAQDDDEMFVTRSTLYTGDGGRRSTPSFLISLLPIPFQPAIPIPQRGEQEPLKGAEGVAHICTHAFIDMRLC